MRLWTLHPKYLDPKGLAALWREALLAQSVLRRQTKGYTRHPQLVRFRETKTPVRCVAEYLRVINEEGKRRGYKFDSRKIARGGQVKSIVATNGQLQFEWAHLLGKLRQRNPKWIKELKSVQSVDPHPLFKIIPGGVEEWEKISGAAPIGSMSRGIEGTSMK
ncbi:MAG: DNA lyase [Deltaproteobacteria bacterium RBG_13_43_22]|nr:MAG: DNA lyase [Deltaproteobacteria bacterium RBG_13_43_22]